MEHEDAPFFPIPLQIAEATEPLLQRIAELVQTKGIDVTNAVLGDFFQDDNSFWFGLLATPAGRVFQFGYDYLHTNPTEGTLSEWDELTSSWTDSIYSDQIRPALKMAQAAA
jgi:hypothetical protein